MFNIIAIIANIYMVADSAKNRQIGFAITWTCFLGLNSMCLCINLAKL